MNAAPWTAVLSAYALIITGLWLYGGRSAPSGSPWHESSPRAIGPAESTAPDGTPENPAAPGPMTLVDGSSKALAPLPRINWAPLESDDFDVYARNLRAAGLPERVVRQIMEAEVRASFDQDRIALIEKESVPFWDACYDTEDEMADELADLAGQETAFLARLVGPLDTATVDEINSRRPKPALRFGNGLEVGKRRALTGVFDRAREAILRAPSENVALANELMRIDAQREAELARLLTPQEREDFEIRNSPLAAEIRHMIRDQGGQVGEEQFRRLFRLKQNLDLQTLAAAGTDRDLSPAFEQFEAEVSKALGGEDP